MQLLFKRDQKTGKRINSMKDIRIISGKRISPSLETVSALLGTKKSDLAKDQVRQIYEKLLPAVQMRIQPKAAMTIDALKVSKDDRKKVLYVMLTIGDGVSRLAEKFTVRNEMLNAMAVDAMADSALFAFEEQLLPHIRQFCLEEGYGIERRLELMKDVPIETQKTVFDLLEAKRTLGLSITSGYMLQPMKSMSLLFELTEDTARQCVEHDCGTCEAKDCQMRKSQTVLLTIEPVPFSQESAAVRISCPKGSRLMDVLRENGFLLPAYCGGTGTCGKCGILLKKGSLPVTPEDKAFFSEDERKNGMRLSCKAVLQENVTIAVRRQEEAAFQTPETEEMHWVKGKTEAERGKKACAVEDIPERCASGGYGVAIDIGTTTLAFSLVRLSDGQIADTYTAVNSQRVFGADVLTRMQAANAGKGNLLSRSVRQDLLTGINALIHRNSVMISDLKQIVIAANTVMLHLLRGYSCKGLSHYPFTPVTLETEELTLSELYADFTENTLQPLRKEQVKVILLPGISAFVGADITAGLYACDVLKADTAMLFLDLGTNGEMALKKGGSLYTASAAAGPAFEAGNIKWGMPGIAGAIAQVAFCNGKPVVQTIVGCPPKGICGTGVIEAAAELYRAGIIDATGKLKDPYFPEGFPLAKTKQGEPIVLHQQDIREIQMAKAAIRAGIEILLQRSGTRPEEIGQVDLAGGFGYFLDTRKAALIGLIPEELLARTKSVGNTSLKGAQRYLLRQDSAALQQIKKSAREISLAQEDNFQELYLKHMAFGRIVDECKRSDGT